MIITGDRSQIDLPGKQKSGLISSLESLRNIDGIAIVELDGKDVMRHKLVARIIDAYEQEDKIEEAILDLQTLINSIAKILQKCSTENQILPLLT